MQDGTALDVGDASVSQPAQRPQLRLAEAKPDTAAGPVRDLDPSCRGRGTERIGSTTTTIVSDPAPTAPAAGHFAVLDLLDEQMRELDEADRTVVTAGPVRPQPHWPAPDAGDTVVRRAPTTAGATPSESRATPAAPERSEGRTDGPAAPERSEGRIDRPVAPTPRPASRTRQAGAGTIIGVGPWRPTTTATPAPSGRTPTLVVTPATEPTTPPQLRVNIVGRYLGATTEDGCVATEHDEPLVIGRRPGSPFADDPYVERCHASLTATPEGVRVEDFGSLNGVYVRLTTPARLGDGDLFRVGHELLSFETLHAATVRRSSTQPLGCPDPGYWARISAMLTPECSAASYPVDDVEVVIGRGDTHLQFPDDDFVDAAHCRVTADDHGAVLEDLDSAHGTFLRLRSGDVVPYDSVLLVGQTLVSVGVHRAK